MRPDLIVLHYTAMTSAVKARDWLCATEAQVSAHYVITETGVVYHLVDEAQRAWHAGAGQWGSVCDVNSRSIGIEIANSGAQPFSEPQMAALEDLMHGIMKRWSIRPERVIGHSDMAPGRKIDPGPRFDWRRLALQDLAVWPDEDEDVAQNLDDFRELATRFGYGAEIEQATLLDAFRSRFRPWAKGPLDRRDVQLIRDLARRYPVDGSATSA